MPHSVVIEEHNESTASDNRGRFCLAAVAAAGLLLLGMPLAAQEQAATSQQQKQVAEKSAGGAESRESQQKTLIEKISAQQVGKHLEITLHCSKAPVQTSLEQPGSGRKGIFVNIADAEVQGGSELKLPEEFHIKIDIKAIDDGGMRGTRFAFNLSEPYDSYRTKVDGNAVVLHIENFFKNEPAATGETSAAAEKAASPADNATAGSATTAAMPQFPNPLQNTGANNTSKLASASKMESSSVAAGTAENSGLISVDFYKIDLHNVFRMLGEISHNNIVVADGVSGTLTLSLSDVPWDFALDIILNLKDLTKQRQNNTIVIYPKDKEFVWPKRADESGLVIDQVSPEKKGDDGVIIFGEGEQAVQSPELIEAKKFLALAIKAEKSGNLETAVQLYGKVSENWPDKKEQSRLANKAATIYLAELHQNAKAVYFAKKALAADKKNASAALNAAVGYANMEEHGQAQQYFDQSISIGSKPSKEALFNYALFSERLQQHEAALRLLSKHDELYGENLDSMVARARILDQQGRRTEADQVYTAILHAGFSVPQDLRAFILARTRSN